MDTAPWDRHEPRDSFEKVEQDLETYQRIFHWRQRLLAFADALSFFTLITVTSLKFERPVLLYGTLTVIVVLVVASRMIAGLDSELSRIISDIQTAPALLTMEDEQAIEGLQTFCDLSTHHGTSRAWMFYALIRPFFLAVLAFFGAYHPPSPSFDSFCINAGVTLTACFIILRIEAALDSTSHIFFKRFYKGAVRLIEQLKTKLEHDEEHEE